MYVFHYAMASRMKNFNYRQEIPIEISKISIVSALSYETAAK